MSARWRSWSKTSCPKISGLPRKRVAGVLRELDQWLRDHPEEDREGSTGDRRQDQVAAAVGVGVEEFVLGRRARQVVGDRGGVDLGLGRLLRGRRHPERRHDPQVVSERDHRADGDHHTEPGPVGVDQGLDQVQLADEAGGRRQACQGEHGDGERPGQEWLAAAETRGITALIGDPGRSYLPRERLEKLAEYQVPVTRDLEDAEIKRTSVWRCKSPR